MIARVEGERQTRQVAELRVVLFLTAVGVLMEVIAQAQVGEGVLHVLHRFVAECMVHADHELMLEPAGGVEVAVELVDMLHRLFDGVDQAHQLQVCGQDVAIFLQLITDKVQGTVPELAAWRIQQNHRNQRAFTGLDQRQHFQRFIQRTETAWAQDQGIGFLDEEQLAGEEKMEGQQVGRALDGGVGMLLEGQGDVESQAVIQARAFVGRRHDAAAGPGDHHQVRARQRGAEFPGHGVQRVLHGGAGGAENRDFTPPAVLFEYTESLFEFAQGLQGDFGVPAVVVFLGHAQHSEDHVAVDRKVRAVG
ncbi:hypothetical protein D3C73_875340 [compost metagenome]